LQELLASAGMDSAVYDLSEQGPDHEKRFFATVAVGGTVLGAGEGRSKRKAEQAAAAVAVRAIAAEQGDRGGGRT
jgi:ribonuclease-3